MIKVKLLDVSRYLGIFHKAGDIIDVKALGVGYEMEVEYSDGFRDSLYLKPSEVEVICND